MIVKNEPAHIKVETDEEVVISKIVRSVGTHDLIRVVLLTSSRANPKGPLDILSDYDIALVVSDTRPFEKDEDWLQGYGKPLLRVRDTQHMFGLRKHNCMVLYSDGTKIDYSIWPPTLFRRIRE